MIISPMPKSTSHLAQPSDSFTALLNTLATWSSSNSKSALSRQQSASSAKLKKMPISSRKKAPYRSLRLANLAQKAAELPLFRFNAEKLDRSVTEIIDQHKGLGAFFVMVNGRFDRALSDLTDLPEGTEVFDLPAAFSAFPAHLMKRSVEDEEEFFALFNAAIADQGTVVFFPPGAKCTSPLYVINIDSIIKPAAVFSRLHIIAGANSALHIALKGHSCRGWQSDFLDLTLEENARVELDEQIITDRDSFGFLSIRAFLKKGAEFHTASFTTGSHCTWRDINVKLMGEGSSTDIWATGALSDDRRFSISAQVEHLSPAARSYQWIRSALDKRARFSFCGKIFVAKKAAQTKSYQLNNNLLLSDEAIADSQPNLQILNDDVKASHGATYGQIRKEDLFYLQSRGISHQSARSLLIRGFVDVGIERIRSSKLRDEARFMLCQLF